MSPTGGCEESKAALELMPWQLFQLVCVALRDRGSAETEIIDPQCNSNRREGARSDEATMLQIVQQSTCEKQQHMIPLRSPAFLNLCKEKGGSSAAVWKYK